MILRFAFCFISHHLCNWNPSITTADNAWGGFSLGRGVMECRKEATRMMVKHGVVLMRGGGRNEGGKRTEGGGELIAAGGLDESTGNVDAKHVESCGELFRKLFLVKLGGLLKFLSLRQQLGQAVL